MPLTLYARLRPGSRQRRAPKIRETAPEMAGRVVVALESSLMWYSSSHSAPAPKRSGMGEEWPERGGLSRATSYRPDREIRRSSRVT
jgi:hypothetical protein